MNVTKITPEQLPTAGYNSILDFRLDDAIQIVHSFPDCNECKFALVYKGDGRNVFKNNFEYRCYCTCESVPVKVPLTLDRPNTWGDLWLPWDIWKPSLEKMGNEKIYLYIPACVLAKKMRRCRVKMMHLPPSEWKGNKKAVIGTIDESLHNGGIE